MDKVLSDTRVLTDESNVWQKILDEYADDCSVDGLLLVKCLEGSDAEVEFYRRDADGLLYLDSHGKAFIGKNGLGKVREGDGMTPEGNFSVRRAFGIHSNPGTRMDYLTISDTIVACDEEGECYNRIVDVRSVGHLCKGEQMTVYPSEYAYGLEIDYNPDNIFPKGSAIFVHCKGEKVYTMGCVALDELLMRHILVSASMGLKVCIHRKFLTAK